MSSFLSKFLSSLDVRKYVAGNARSPGDFLAKSGEPFHFDATELEPRVLYSATPIDLEGFNQGEIGPELDVSAIEESFFENQVQLTGYGISLTNDEEFALKFVPDELSMVDQSETQANYAGPNDVELVFIDTNVDGWHQLRNDLMSQPDSQNVAVILLDADRDGIEQIGQALGNYDNVAAIHLISHGNENQLNLGSTTLTSQNIAGYASDMVDWRDSLADGSDLLIYGCDLASSQSGLELIDGIAALSGADVAASDDLTGHALLGGDWDLEVSVGAIESEIAFTSQLQQSWVSVLVAPTIDLPAGPLEYGIGAGPTVIDATATLTDPDSADFAGGHVIVSIANNGTANDQLQVDLSGNFSIGGPNLRYLGTKIADVISDGSNGADLRFDFNGSASKAIVEELLQNVQYSNSSGTPSTLARTVEVVVNDGTDDSNIASETINFVDPSPEIDLDGDDSNAAGLDFQTTYYAGGGPVKIVDLDFSYTDEDSTNWAEVTVDILGTPADRPNEVLGYDLTGTGITLVQWNANAGRLILGGDRPIAEYLQVLQTLTYENTAITDTTPRTIEIHVEDAEGNPSNVAISTVNIQQTSGIWLTTTAGSTTGANGIGNWGNTEVIELADPNLRLETTLPAGTTDGTFTSVRDFGLDMSISQNLNGMHFVSRDILIGGATNTLQLEYGDILFTVEDDAVLNGITIDSSDVGLYDASTGLYSVLLDNLTVNPSHKVTAITLVEQATVVGDVSLSAGSFLFGRNATGFDANDIWYFDPTGIGDGSTTGDSSVRLIEGDDIGIFNGGRYSGLELVESTTMIGGTTLQSGWILASASRPEFAVGTSGIATTEFDVFYIDALTTTMGTGTTVASAGLVVDGSDVGLSEILVEEISGLTLNSSEAAPVDGTTLAVNSAPVITSDGGGATASINVAENTTAVTLVAATDSDVPADTLTYSITGGNDSLLFTIDSMTGELEFTSGRDFGVFTDFDSNGVYEVQVTVDDGNFASDVQDISVTITNGNVAPTDVGIDNSSINENIDTTGDTLIGNLSSTDANAGDTFTYSVFGGADAGDFSVIGDQLFLDDGLLNFEVKNSYSVDIETRDDGGLTFVKTITINVNDLNEAPTAITPNGFNINENTDTSGGFSIGTLLASDEDSGETFSYSINGGADAGLFTIGGSGDELILTDGVLNFESKNSYSVIVRATDSGGLTHDETITVSVNDVNEAPSISLANVVNSIDENTDTTTAIRIADIVINDDALGSNNLVLSGPDSANFEIVGLELRLQAGVVLDFETMTSFDVTVEVDDPGIGGSVDDAATHSLTVNDLNEAPAVSLVNVVNAIDENTDTTTAIRIADIVINDDVLGTNNLVLSGPDFADFEIVGLELRLRAGVVLDFETMTSFDVTVEVDDPGIGGSVDDAATHSLMVNDLNEAPAVSLVNVVNAIDENTDTTTAIRIADIVINDDVLGTNNLALSGPDFADFEIVGLELRLRAGVVLDFATMASFDVTVEVDDPGVGGPVDDATSHSLMVNDVNEAPTVDNPIVGVTVNEDAADTVIDLTTVFGDVDTASLAFTIQTNTSPLLVDVTIAGNFLTLDYLSDQFGVSTVTVRGFDGTSFVEDTFNVTINPINDAPVLTGNGSLQTTLENDFNPPGDTIGNLISSHVTDVDPSASLAGIAVIGNLANPVTEGVWEYSTDAGSNWQLVGVVAEGPLALALSSNSLVRFVPVANYLGIPASLDIRAIDDSYSGGFTVGLGRVNVDSSANGGISSISSATSSIDTNVADAGIVVTPVGGLTTTESGGTSSFTVVLISAPTATVSISVGSDDFNEGVTSTSVLVFDATNWNVAQTVVVIGVDDFVDDGDIGYSIVLDPAVSADASYNGLDAVDVAVTSVDDDTAGIVVSETSIVTNESGTTATFEVALSSRPLTTVTIGVSSSDPTEGTVSTNVLVFNPSNWNVPQVVTVTGQFDTVLDGDISFQVFLASAVSADPNYSNLDPNDVKVINKELGVPANPPPTSLISLENDGDEDEEGELPAAARSVTNHVDQADEDDLVPPRRVTSIINEVKLYRDSDSPETVEHSTDPTYLYVEANSKTAEEQSIEQIASSYSTASLNSSSELWTELDYLRQRMDSDVLMPTIVVGGVASMASALTVGYVTWLIRGGQILMGVLARMPAWKLIDPLPILAALDQDDDDSDKESLASMIDESNERSLNTSSEALDRPDEIVSQETTDRIPTSNSSLNCPASPTSLK